MQLRNKQERKNGKFEINRPHNSGRLYNFLIKYKFQKALEDLPFSIKGLSLLDICCGSGMISEYYARGGAKVTGIDLSEDAINRAKIRKERYKFEAEFKVTDANNLPFADNFFDIVSVHDGLHHLENPKRAVEEMGRVAKKAVVIIEPAKALITRIFVRLGVSTDYEETDFVYRFRKNEMRQWLKAAGTQKVISRRYLMYYPHQPGKVFRIFDNKAAFFIAKTIFQLLNILLGRLGNKIQVIGLK